MVRLRDRCRLRHPGTWLLVTDRRGGAVPTGESSQVHLLRCTPLDVLVRNAGQQFRFSAPGSCDTMPPRVGQTASLPSVRACGRLTSLRITP